MNDNQTFSVCLVQWKENGKEIKGTDFTYPVNSLIKGILVEITY